MRSDPKQRALKRGAETVISTAYGVVVIIVILAGWEMLSWTGTINSMFSSSPSRIVLKGITMFQNSAIYGHILASGKLFLAGYLLSVVVGVPLGIAMGWFKRVNWALAPIMAAFYTTPRIALMPMFIIWLGLGFKSQLALVFLSGVFNIALNMQTAMYSLDKDLNRTAIAYGATQWQLFFTVALPESVPYLMTALRLASGRAFAGVVGAELFGGAQGVGYLIQYSGATFQTDVVFVCVIILAVFGILLDRILFRINRHFDKWRNYET
jgi:NitT/TauT family transport system permease protein